MANERTDRRKLLDELLKHDFIEPPDDFHDRVVRRMRLDAEVVGARRCTPAPRWQWLALAMGAALGVMQVAGFIFGLWTAVAVA